MIILNIRIENRAEAVLNLNISRPKPPTTRAAIYPKQGGLFPVFEKVKNKKKEDKEKEEDPMMPTQDDELFKDLFDV